MNGGALDRLRAVFRMGRPEASALLSGWFYDYHADLYLHGVPFDVYLEKARAIRRELGEARRVLDAGAGFGVYACLLGILGVPEVLALDYHEAKARDAARLAAHLGLGGVRVLHGDALALPFRDAGMDGAMALASLSHVREPDAALAEIARVLRPGGRAYLFEDNNSTYPPYRRRMAPVWEGAETGRYPEGMPEINRIPEPHLALRRRLIAGRFPDLSGAELERCAAGSRGLYGEGLFAAVAAWRGTGRLPNPHPDWIRHPVTGEALELPLNPFLLKRLCRLAGLEPRLVNPHAGPFRGRWRGLKHAASGLFSACPALLPFASPLFSVVAVKR